jgi:hypothetical protein
MFQHNTTNKHTNQKQKKLRTCYSAGSIIDACIGRNSAAGNIKDPASRAAFNAGHAGRQHHGKTRIMRNNGLHGCACGRLRVSACIQTVHTHLINTAARRENGAVDPISAAPDIADYRGEQHIKRRIKRSVIHPGMQIVEFVLMNAHHIQVNPLRRPLQCIRVEIIPNVRMSTAKLQTMRPRWDPFRTVYLMNMILLHCRLIGILILRAFVLEFRNGA